MFAGESDPPAPYHFPFDRGLIADKYRVKRVMPENPNADPYNTPASLPVLFCICDRWPVPFNFALHCTAARHLMGETLSDWLSVPQTSFRDDLKVALYEWPILYGEMLLVLMVVVLFSPVLAGPVVLYLLLTRPS
jgi:hypothetical protein